MMTPFSVLSMNWILAGMQPAEMGFIPHSRIALWGGERRKSH